MWGLIHSMLVITPFTVIVESGMNSAVSEWCAAAGTASSARANAASATFDGVFIGFCPLTPLQRRGPHPRETKWSIGVPLREVKETGVIVAITPVAELVLVWLLLEGSALSCERDGKQSDRGCAEFSLHRREPADRGSAQR